MPRSPTKEQAAGAASTTTVPARRGRPPKLGKPKITATIVATGKGRGRPKKLVKGDGEEAKVGRSAKALGRKPKARKHARSGRPRKEQPDDDSEDDYRSDDDKRDDEERRPVGRPPTGAINLNIVRTGRGQGRPKKTTKRALSKSNANSGPPKKLGRPSLGLAPYVPTGKPRGRPKLNKGENATEGEANEPAEKGLVSVPKKTGRPSLGKAAYVPTGKPRGRPKLKAARSSDSRPESKNGNDDDDEDIESEQNDETPTKLATEQEDDSVHADNEADTLDEDHV